MSAMTEFFNEIDLLAKAFEIDLTDSEFISELVEIGYRYIENYIKENK